MHFPSGDKLYSTESVNSAAWFCSAPLWLPCPLQSPGRKQVPWAKFMDN